MNSTFHPQYRTKLRAELLDLAERHSRIIWQAEYMIGGARDHVLALACIRHELPSAHGRGMDRLPGSVTEPLESSLVGSFDPGALWRALSVVIRALQFEVSETDSAMAARIGAELDLLATIPDLPAR